MSVNNPTYRSSRSRIRGAIPLSLKERAFRFKPTLATQRNAISVTVKPFEMFKGGPGRKAVATMRPMSNLGVPGAFNNSGIRILEKAALKKIAWRMVKPRPLELIEPLVRPLILMAWNQYIDPDGFPGWGEFPEGFTSDPGTPYPGTSPGDYTANGFDNGPYGVTAENLIDTSDGTPAFGFRYWGHFPYNNPGPANRAVDWPAAQPLAMPQGALRTRASTKAARVIYNKLENLADPQTQTSGPRWPNNNVAIKIGLKSVTFTRDTPRKRDREDKAKPKSAFVYAVLRTAADALGETKEWIDMLADAAGYEFYGGNLPKALRFPHQLLGKETQKKAYYLFVLGGFNNIDFDKLRQLVVENNAEDAAFGFMGRLAAQASRRLGLTVGLQTGPLI